MTCPPAPTAANTFERCDSFFQGPSSGHSAIGRPVANRYSDNQACNPGGPHRHVQARYLMRRMRISTLLADPNHSSFRQHHVTTPSGDMLGGVISLPPRYLPQAMPGRGTPACALLDSAGTRAALQPVLLQWRVPRTGGETGAPSSRCSKSWPRSPSGAIVGGLVVPIPTASPSFPPRFEKLAQSVQEGGFQTRRTIGSTAWNGVRLHTTPPLGSDKPTEMGRRTCVW
ncbi:hypothetical protein V8C42DRAFT_330400 [Trichoderma barbatum]